MVLFGPLYLISSCIVGVHHRPSHSSAISHKVTIIIAKVYLLELTLSPSML